MGKIATEQYCASIGGGSGYTNNLCATKSRAQALGCNVSGSYANNQLVEEGSLSSANVGISEFPIFYTNSDQSSYTITTNILSRSTGWIPYLMRVIPKNYFGTDNWEISSSRWLMIAPPAYWQCFSSGYTFYMCNDDVMNSLYNGYNTGDYTPNSPGYLEQYWFPHRTRGYTSTQKDWHLNNGWPLKSDTLRTYNKTNPMYGIAHCDAFIGGGGAGANFYLQGDNNVAYCPTLAELLVIMYNFNTINNIINQFQGAGWIPETYNTDYVISTLPYCNYLSNTYGPYGYYYTRPITGDGGIRPSYVYDDEIQWHTYNCSNFTCYSWGYNTQAIWLAPKNFNMLGIVNGEDWYLSNCMSSTIDYL